jgi:succinate dehydrogenase / fumarate reductase iron-sulfur subunit
MRLRRVAGEKYELNDRNNGHRHEAAFVTLVRDYGLLHEAELLPRSYGGNSWFGKFAPPAGKELLDSLPVVVKGLMRRKMNPKIALFGHKIAKDDLNDVKRIYEKVEGQEGGGFELNLYISGYDEDDEGPGEREPVAAQQGSAPDPGQPGQEPEDSPTR